jgi:hypothetical protein
VCSLLDGGQERRGGIGHLEAEQAFELGNLRELRA